MTQGAWKTADYFEHEHWVNEAGIALCEATLAQPSEWRERRAMEVRTQCPSCTRALNKQEAVSFPIAMLQHKRDLIAEALQARREGIARLDEDVRRVQASLDAAIQHKDKLAGQLEEIEHALNLLGGA